MCMWLNSSLGQWLVVGLGTDTYWGIQGAFNKFSDFFVQAFKIVINSRKFPMLLLYILWDDWPIFMISDSNEHLQQQLEYTLLKPDCHSWWISKIQSGCDDTLEEWYAIKFCFKLGKNATEMYRMLQTAFWPSCMNQASVFKWHKRFKECRQSVRDDKRCEKSKKVRTPELIGQIKNLMDKDRRVFIETISAQFDVSVGTVHTIIHEELKMRKICAKFVPRVLKEDQKERCRHDSREMVELIDSDPAVLNALVTCDESWIYCYDPETKRQSSQWKHAGSPWPKKARQQIHLQTFDDPFFWQHWHDLHALGSHWTDSQQGILCWGFKGVQQEIPSEEASTLQIGSVAFPPGHYTSPQLHPCHRLSEQDEHQDSSSASLLSRPCSQWLLVIP